MSFPVQKTYQTTTLSLVVFTIQDLMEHAKTIPLQGMFCKGTEQLVKDLKERFDYIINVSSSHFEPSHVIAVALDLRYKGSLKIDQREKAKSLLFTELNHISLQQITNPIVNAEDSLTTADGEPKLKRFQFATVRRPTTPVSPGVTPLQDELDRYFNDFTSISEDADPVEYWRDQNSYPLIGDLAVDYLVTPCSSASVESMFSHAGFLCSGMRSSMTAKNLGSQVLIKTNFLALK